MIRFSGQRHAVRHMDFLTDLSYLVTIGGSSAALWFWDLKDPKKPEKFQFPKLPSPQRFYRLGGLVISHKNEIVVQVTIDRNYTDVNQTRYQHCFYMVSWPSRELQILPDLSSNWPNSMSTAKGRSCLVIGGFQSCWSLVGSELKWERLDLGLEWYEKLIPSDNLEWFVRIRGFEVWTYNALTKTFSNSRTFDSVPEIKFSPSGKYFVLNHTYKHFQVYETSTFQPIGTVIELSPDQAFPQFTPDDRRLLISSQGAIHIFDTHSSEELACYDFKIGRIVTLKISDDGLMCAVSGESRELVVADLEP